MSKELTEYKREFIKRMKYDIKQSKKYLQKSLKEYDFDQCLIERNNIENFEYIIDLIKIGLYQ